jgi:hypothetical protein
LETLWRWLDPQADFLQAATWHGTLETAAALLAAHPEIASGDIYTPAVLGDAPALQRFLALEPGNATAKGGPHGWDALTYLCSAERSNAEAIRIGRAGAQLVPGESAVERLVQLN